MNPRAEEKLGSISSLGKFTTASELAGIVLEEI
jgi:hypothetical protein